MPSFVFPDEFTEKLVRLHSPDGGRLLISPHGAHVLSWVGPAGDERLFLSPRTSFSAGAAIRGGVPVIFPQFSERGSLPKHGFARNHSWEVARVTVDSAVFWLAESDESRLIWPHRFLAEYTVRLKDQRLEMNLSITNTDVSAFSFSAALHTYLQVGDLARTAVLGLQGCHYLDSANGGMEQVEAQQQVEFTGEVDRIYCDAPVSLRLRDADREMQITTTGFPDAVVWNPGPQKCARLGDMEPDGYLRFVCVEAALAAHAHQLAPGEHWHGTQVLAI